MQTKKCTKCKQIKSISEFYKRNNGKYLQSMCKTCDKFFRKKREEKKLGRKIGNRNKLWSEIEIKKLKKYYNKKKPIEEISSILSRSDGAIYNKLWELSLTSRLVRWSEKEKEYLLKNFYKLPINTIANNLGRSIKSVEHAAKKLDLIFRKTTWIEKEIEKYIKTENIVYSSQKKIGQFWVDFLIDKLVIEVQGSYWHCDPEIFKYGAINTIQKNNIKRDIRKRNYLLEKGYTLLYIWEKDIKENYLQICQELHVVLNRDVKNNNQAKSVELLRDNTEVTAKQAVP